VHLAVVVPPGGDVKEGTWPSGGVQARLRYLQPTLLHNLQILLGVKGLDAEVLVPQEDVLVRSHDAGVHEPLGKPPSTCHEKLGSMNELADMTRAGQCGCRIPHHLVCPLALI
jgi:hypothetical protein